MIRPLRTALLLSISSTLFTGCAVVGVKVKKHDSKALRETAIDLARQNDSDSEAQLLAKAQKKGLPAAEKLAALIEVARTTANAPTASLEQRINKIATAEIVALMAGSKFAPQPLPGGKFITVSTESRTTLDPRIPDGILPADAVQITKLRVRTMQDGAGLPCIAHFARNNPALRGQPGIPPLAGIAEPVTVLVRLDGSSPQLAFYRTRQNDTCIYQGREVKLAADFSAPLAYMLSKGKNRNIDVRALIRTDLNMDHAGLYQFQRFDPEKIPVVMVHGLMSRPETWVPAVNELLADKEVREHYQFWFFLYPTGLPVWASAAKLRAELDRYRIALDPQHKNPNFSRMILAGHSMGGLISSLQIREGGKKLWKQFTDTSPAELSLTPELKQRIIRTVEFHPRPEIARVVFFSVPHRGSDLAMNPFAEFFASLIRLPFTFLKADQLILQRAVRPEFREIFVAPANSVMFLRAKSPLLQAILNLPMRKGVPYHSIIGDRGKGDTPESSDGVVPYWSSHLDGAASEKIVPSGHGSNENPEGIEEFRRILHNSF
ncbi:MAG: hypothetical protein WCI38_10040 [Chthoniobacterales bacterium]